MKCGVSETNLKMSLLMYSSYFVLFARFFYNTYVGSRTGGKGEKCKASSAGEMILKIEKKIQQQTEEIVSTSSTEASKNNHEPTQPHQDDNNTEEENRKSNQGSFVKNTKEKVDKELEDTENDCNKKTERKDSSDISTCQNVNDHSRVDSMKVADLKMSTECADQDIKDENKSPDDIKLDDNTNANSTSQK